MLCNKISENPRKGFLQLLARGINKIKNEYIFEPYLTQAFFCTRSWNVSRSFWDTLVPILQTPCSNFGIAHFVNAVGMLRKKNRHSKADTISNTWQSIHSCCKTISYLQNFIFCKLRSLGRVSEVRACYPKTFFYSCYT